MIRPLVESAIASLTLCLLLHATPAGGQTDRGAPVAIERMDQDSLFAPATMGPLPVRASGAGSGIRTGQVRLATEPLSGEASPGATWSIFEPPCREGAAAIYDPVRRRMLVFGGRDGTYSFHGDVWELTLTDHPMWRKLATTGPSPIGRARHTVIYDPRGDRAILFGGFYANEVGHTYLADAWSLSLTGTAVWTPLAAIGPGPRDRHTAVYDPVSERMIVFGGKFDETLYNDTWALRLNGTPAWQELVPAGVLPSRADHVAIYDPIRRRMLVHGGDPVRGSADLWALDLGAAPAWVSLPIAGSPLRWSGHTAVYDALRDRMLVAGDGEGTWALPLSAVLAWQPVATEPGPSTRYRATAIYDPEADRMVLFGGDPRGELSILGDAWSLELDVLHWSPIGTPEPPILAREGHSTVFDAPRERLVVFGGHDGQRAIDDLWIFPLSERAWRRIQPVGPPPAARFNHSAILDEPRDRMIVFGGADNDVGWHHFNDVWELSFPDFVWRRLEPDGLAPAGRKGHSAVVDAAGDRMLVYGGFDESVRFDDVHAMSLSGDPSWGTVPALGTPPQGRWGHAAVFDPTGRRMIVFGGIGTTMLSDLWSLSLSHPATWSPHVTAVGPPARFMPAAGYDVLRDRMVVHSGFTNVPGVVYRKDAWVLDLSGEPRWLELHPAGPGPPGRLRSGAVYDPRGDRLIVVAGRENNYLMGDTWGLAFGSPVIHIRLDIKPGDPENTIALHAHGVLPAGILGDPAYDVAGVVIDSVRLAGAAVQRRANGTRMVSFDDLNHDGRTDLLLHFPVADLGLRRIDTAATLTGCLATGERIEGQDAVRILSVPHLADPEEDDGLPASVRVTSPWQRSRPLAIEIVALPTARVIVDLVDLSGRRLATRAIDGLAGRHVVEFHEPIHWPSGVYFLRATFGGWTRLTRFVLL